MNLYGKTMDTRRTKVLSIFSEHLSAKDAKKLEISLYNFIIVKSRAERVERSWENKTFCRFFLFY